MNTRELLLELRRWWLRFGVVRLSGSEAKRAGELIMVEGCSCGVGRVRVGVLGALEKGSRFGGSIGVGGWREME